MPYNSSHGLRKTFKRFCAQTSLSGFKYIINKKRSALERTFWLFVIITFLSATIYFVNTLWFSLLESPTVTTLYDTSYPVTKVPFPGISICNVNKISKRKANEFAKYLVHLLDGQVDIQSMLKNISLLGNLYDFDSSHLDDLMYFQRLLDTIQPKSNISFKVNALLRNLYTPCEELLIYCKIGHETYNCSELFNMRLTYEGYCCVFNSVKKPKKSTTFYEKEVRFLGAGQRNELQVTVNNTPDDYFYTTTSIIGVNVQVFHAEDYPDSASGGLVDVFVSYGSENFLAITPTVFQSAPEVQRYSVDKRQCYFKEEKHTTLSGTYSESDCLVDCRKKIMMALCDCIPFMIPVSENESVCNLVDIPCLYQFKRKWNSIKPSDIRIKELSREMHESLDCDVRCYPLCDSTIYAVSTTSNPFIKSLMPKHIENVSIIHAYYTRNFVHLYKQNVMYEWFEILSNFGGTFGLFMGMSIISLIEIITYFTYKWFHYSQF